ncbi:tetratricopeptide repeat protein [Hymenobacter properus]|uniref:Tetratricopeptide repeat protein n=1 Tax=Hymenobacter properus TaxID=2791026 RepID=A0A931BLI1_9BACT|nr:tetratricopeptide repeat protein [Hymenobacter properus]MBF9143572.1 tetratricopeptide repeat protein [Hymenobacter properus]MBR7722385.1 tetratricopeptide repeat protein [Microvirga sp. SRT04]
MQPPISPSLPSLARIWQLLELRRPALAEAAAKQRLAADPADWQTLLALTEALRQQQRLEEAHGAALAAIQAEANAHQAHFALAQVLGSQGQLRQAEATVRQALQLNPRVARYHGFRAQLFYLLHNYRAAIGSAEEGLKLAPAHADCLLWRAMAQESLDQPTAANEDFQRLLRVAPESELVHAHLGRVLLRRYQPAGADRHLTKALRQNPNREAELVPLLRLARRRQRWPEWFLRSERQHAERRALGLDPGLGSLLRRVWATGAVARAWWHTRHDPLFALTPAQRWRRWQFLWVSLIIVVPVLIFVGDYFKFFDASKPLTIPQMLVLLAAGGFFQLVIHLLGKKANSTL